MHNRRWYDQEPACTLLLKQIQDMPQPEVRTFCARIIINFSEKLRKAIHQKRAEGVHLGSVQQSALSSLYKFGYEKNRWYDKEPSLYMAVATFYTLPPEGLAALGFQLGDTFGLILIYARVCHQLGHPPETADLVKICMTALQVGIQEGSAVLIDLVGQDLYESLRRQSPQRPFL